jgi:predicted glutamine amidotransferase
MCRLFGLLGSEPTPADAWLTGTERSLLAQAHADEAHAQAEGWGIAWYPTSRTPRVEKGIHGAFEATEVERFRSIASQARGPVVVGHLRRASNPMNLPKARLLGLENSQPFTHESLLFAHNGSVPYPRETRPLLGKYEPRVRGVNDSEVLFWLLVRHLEESADPLTAYARSVDDLVKVWGDQGRPAPGPYTGLNVLFTRGPNELWAFCLWRGEHGGGFFDEHRPYYQLAYRADAKHAVVGSEPFDARPDWRSLASGEFLHVQASHGLVATKTGPIPLSEETRSVRAPA